MKIINTIEEIKQHLNGKTNIGFVPTMGALHAGHISLIQRAREECEIVVVSIFVNPTQFLVGEDLSKYPRTFEHDSKVCEEAGVDIIFYPDIKEMYHENEMLIKAPKKAGYILEGLSRPGHFDGVLRVVLKLFNIVNPHRAYFGKKDAQQLLLIKKMVSDLFLDIEIKECEIIRDNDGFALSSRNRYLSEDERTKALSISQSLFQAQELINGGELDVQTLHETILKNLHEDLQVEYIAILKRDFSTINTIIKDASIILIAIKVGTTRLIDNMWV